MKTEESLPEPRTPGVGSVAALWRYPVKSLLGEELEEAGFSGQGIPGDRAYAVADGESGQVRNAKRAGWQDLFSFSARLEGDATAGVSSLRIVTPDGRVVAGDGPDRDRLLSEAFGREARLEDAGGPFFDLAAVHLLTTASLEKLRELYGEGDFDARRFRPNVVVELDSGETGFVEDGWLGRTLRLGEEVVMEVTDPVARCVMTTLAQGDLPKDPKIMSTTYRYNDNRVGVYARVVRGGRVRRGDRVELD